MALPRLSSLFRRSDAQSLFSGPEIPGDLCPETARALAKEALASKGEHGAIALLARKYQVKRHVVDGCRAAIEEHLTTLFQPLPSVPVVTITLDRRAIDRGIVSARAEYPISIRGIRRIGAMFLGFLIGYGTIWDTLDQAQATAKAWLCKLDLRAVKTIALDELFFAGRCVLVVIDVKTQTLCGVEVADDRTEATWTKLLTRLRDEQGLDPAFLVSDAGGSILASAHEVFPSAVQQRDLFHIKRDLGQILDRLEKQAYAALEHYYKAEVTWRKAPKGDRSTGQKLRRASEEADRKVELYDRVFSWVKQVFFALEFVDPHTGAYQDGAMAEAIIGRIAEKLLVQKDGRLKKAGTFLSRHKGALSAYHSRLARTLTQLANNIDEQAVVLTTACLGRLDHQLKCPMYLKERKDLRTLRNRLVDDLRALSITPARFAQLILQTVEAIQCSGRASSLVECFNSVFRKFLRIHKHVSPGPLCLVTARWNLMPRESGKLAGSCPYTALTGHEVSDWLAELGLPANPLPGPRSGYLPTHTNQPASESMNQPELRLRLVA